MRESLQPHRLDRDASQRRARAQAHLHRVRRQRRGGLSLRQRRLLVVAVAGLCGALFGDVLLAAATGRAQRPLDAIAVRGASRLTPAEIARATGIAGDATLAQIDSAAVVRSLESHDWIAEAVTLPLPGGTLVVGVVERRPLATVTLENTLYAVDERGTPFAPLEPAALPGLVRLVTDAHISPRQPSPSLAEALRLALRLPQLGMAAPVEVRVATEGDPEGFALRLAALRARVVLGREDLDARLDDLVRLVAARPDAVAQATSIDLRFADQVVLWSGPAQEGSANTAAERGRAAPRNRRPTG